MANDKNREPEFTVTDRRKYNLDEILQSPPAEETKPQPEEAGDFAKPAEASRAAVEAAPPDEHSAPSIAIPIPAPIPIEEGWDSPSNDEQSAQSQAYQESGRHLDSALDAQQPGLSQQVGAASFDRLVALISTQALLLMGALAPEGQQPRVDVVGARQQIDLLDILKEKTQGNLDIKEQSMLDNTLFELRMMFIEIMNAFAKSPIQKA
ncbi:MAG: DUF1844 domain-containing protein [Acidobacteriaceae bacterium]